MKIRKNIFNLTHKEVEGAVLKYIKDITKYTNNTSKVIEFNIDGADVSKTFEDFNFIVETSEEKE